MKVLVTGGAGFIGSRIVDFLIKAGHETVVIDNLSTGRKDFVNPKAIFYQADITKSLDTIFHKETPEIVIHTAAQTMLRYSIENPIFDATTNIIGTINVLEACKKFKVKKIIYTSTGGARVGEPKYLPVDENHPLNPSSPYGISKHSAEHYVWLYNQLCGIDYLIFCFGNVYGPRDNPKSNRATPIFSWKILTNQVPQIFGDGNQTRDFIYVLDLAEFIVANMTKSPEHKLFHLANGEQTSVNELFALLKEFSQTKIEAIHTESIKGEIRDIVLDTRLAQKELNWKPKTTFREGIKETFNWMKENKKLFE
ncbi:MAG: GDP-mannose 4,6-dehydratase [Candidatus Diapherotrites archaeon]|nr:GDP-mannose 4,6-dehydratase [Candidatus Diapherotrites archaeon]